MLGCKDVFKHRHGFPQADVLERAGNAELCDLVGRRVENFILEIHLGVHALIFLLHLPRRMRGDHEVILKKYLAVCRLVYAGDAVEGRRFARAVGADERDDLALIDVEREIVHRHNAAELHGDIFHTEH